MLRARCIYLQDKQAFAKEDGNVLRLIGKPIDIAKQWKQDGVELLHIIDLDGHKGSTANMDVYDKLTYLLHVQVDCGEHEALVEKLLAINARVVVGLPTRMDLKKRAVHRRLLVGKIPADYRGSVENVYDLLLENATLERVKAYAQSGRRVLVSQKDYQKGMEKLVFGVVEGL